MNPFLFLVRLTKLFYLSNPTDLFLFLLLLPIATYSSRSWGSALSRLLCHLILHMLPTARQPNFRLISDECGGRLGPGCSPIRTFADLRPSHHHQLVSKRKPQRRTALRISQLNSSPASSRQLRHPYPVSMSCRGSKTFPDVRGVYGEPKINWAQ